MVCLEENFDLLHSIDPRHNTSKGTYTYQIMKVFASKYAEIDQNIYDAYNFVSLENAVSIYLDFHGIEYGIFRKSGNKAECHVKITGKAVGFPIPIGSRFATASGRIFTTTEKGLLPTIMSITKGVGTDGIPEPHSDVQSISWINTNPSQTGTSYVVNVDWTFDSGTQVITWLGVVEPAAGSTYFVGLDADEDVSTSIQAIAAGFGEDYKVTPGMITVNTDSLSGVSSVTNDEDSIGGDNIEDDILYRNRMRRSSNVQFGYERIASLVAGLDFVRSCRVYQNTGVDQAFPETDWEEASTWSTLENHSLYSTDDVAIAQTFQVTQGIISIAQLSLYMQKVGLPPPLRVSAYLWRTDYATTISRNSLWSQIFTNEEVDPDYPDNWQEVFIKCRHGGLDYTKTYILMAETIEKTSDASNHWKLKYQAAGDEYTDGAMYVDGGSISGGDLAFKTRWGGASFNVVVSLNEGESFDLKRDAIEEEITMFERKASTPISIQANVLEATEAEINVTCTIYTDGITDWDSVKTACRININDYINGLGPGENIIFSSIERSILLSPGVAKINNCTIQKNAETLITKAQEYDIKIGKDEIAVLGSPGTTFTEGTW